jgi:hypothetical protein
VDEVLRAARRVLPPAELRVLRDAEVRRREEAEEAFRLLRALAEADLDLLEADFERLPLVFDFDRLADLLRVRDVAERCLARLRPELDGIWQSPPYVPLRCFSLSRGMPAWTEL